MKAEWETIYRAVNPDDNDWETTNRMKVPGGWLVRNQTVLHGKISESMCFVPDAPNAWKSADSKVIRHPNSVAKPEHGD